MTIVERLTFTGRMSWTDRKYHLRKLQRTIPNFDIDTIRKIYLLGYAEASEQVLISIIQCVRTNSVWGLKHIFNSLPYGEDELGLTVIGDLLSVYLLCYNTEAYTLYVINKDSRPEFIEKASGLFYLFSPGKKIIYSPLSLSPY